MPGKDEKKHCRLGWSEIQIEDLRIPCLSAQTLVIGSGAASLNAAVRLHEEGQTGVVVITEKLGSGTSYNSGSDKQTYYKPALSGEKNDSPRKMAEDLFSGGCMHGDIALCEAENSLRCFFHLVESGVPFPHDKFGSYAGYKTDHDPLGRATSAGPRTSRFMVQALAQRTSREKIPVLEGYQIATLLTSGRGSGKKVVGALAVNQSRQDAANLGLTVFNAVNIILGTGGPAGIYENSVYPPDQFGATGAALAAGAIAHNLTESQFGIASLKFRWNLSGSYQQVVPRYVSTDKNGGDEREFLNSYFPDTGKMATAVFLKGYQWPFDPEKVCSYGSSLIDLLVYRERNLKGRKVFLDFTRNPSSLEPEGSFSLDCLSREAYRYLKRSGALQKTPIERLKKLNKPAADLFLEKGIDLSREYVEAAVCAQHSNGGLAGGIWWESNLHHLFPVGEVNGTHGVKRPGGSALNSGQVGGLRAAQYIARNYPDPPRSLEEFMDLIQREIKGTLRLARNWKEGSGSLTWKDLRTRLRKNMTRNAGMIRNPDDIKAAAAEAWKIYRDVIRRMKITSSSELFQGFRNWDLGVTHAVYLEALKEYMDKGGGSRGSFLVLDSEGVSPCPELKKNFRFRMNQPGTEAESKILEIRLDKNLRVHKKWVDIRPVPKPDNWFENIWKQYIRDQKHGSGEK